MKQNVKFIGRVLSKKSYLLIAAISSLLFFSGFIYLSNFDLMRGNLGLLHTSIYSLLSMLVVVLFGLYISLFVFRWKEKKALFAKSFGVGAVGTGASVLVNGCAACSITLASYLGLASVVSALPFYGLELTVLGAGLLGFSIKKLSDEKPKTCEMKK